MSFSQYPVESTAQLQPTSLPVWNQDLDLQDTTDISKTWSDEIMVHIVLIIYLVLLFTNGK